MCLFIWERDRDRDGGWGEVERAWAGEGAEGKGEAKSPWAGPPRRAGSQDPEITTWAQGSRLNQLRRP